MHDVFISYSSKELFQAVRVRRVLEKNGISCWMAPSDIPGGSNYTKEIPIAIRGCQVFVLMLSTNAQSSHWVLKELDSAVNAGKVILPFMLENCELNDEFNFLLSGAQRYSAYQRSAEALEKLVIRIRAIIGTDAPTAFEGSGEEAPPAPVMCSAEPVESGAAKPADGEVVCPACGGRELIPYENMKHSHNMKERLFYLMVPVFCLVIPVLAIFVWALFCVIISASGALAETGMVVVFLVSFVLSAYFGRKYVQEQIRRSRVRTHIRACGVRCGSCAKKFRAAIPAEETFPWEVTNGQQ